MHIPNALIVAVATITVAAPAATASVIFSDNFSSGTSYQAGDTTPLTPPVASDGTYTAYGYTSATWSVTGGILDPVTPNADNRAALLTTSTYIGANDKVKVESDITWSGTKRTFMDLFVGAPTGGGFGVRWVSKSSGGDIKKFEFASYTSNLTASETGTFVRINDTPTATAGTYHMTLDIDRSQDFDLVTPGKQVQLIASVTGPSAFSISGTYTRNDVAGAWNVGYRWRINEAVAANDVAFDVDNLKVTLIPEPSMLGLMAVGGALLLRRPRG